MGVKLLWPELAAAAQETTLEILALSAFLHDGEVVDAETARAVNGGSGSAGSSSSARGDRADAKQPGPVRRHLVLGIDASIWLYHAMTLKNAGGGNAEVRMLFFRLAKLYALPIMPIFVFDGPGRPQLKRNKLRRGAASTSRYSFPHQAEFEQLIRLFGFGALYAPAEAEAQLAKMNEDGVVDAILTDDGDAFLFGAQVVLRNSSKTLSGNKARATRLQQKEGEGDSDGQFSDQASQASASSTQSQVHSRRKGSKGNPSANGKSSRGLPSDGDSASMYSPSEVSDGDEGPSKKASTSKLKALSSKEGKPALQGKIEDTYTVYRSFLIFDSQRASSDARIFSRKQLSQLSQLSKERQGDVSIKSLNKDGLILTALLSGGDYDVDGFARCGMKTAIALARCGFGKRLLDSFKKNFVTPSYSRRNPNPKATQKQQNGSTSSSWKGELAAWIRAVQHELRTNSQGFMERKATKLADSPEWNKFLGTQAALDVVQSYVWPQVAEIAIEDVLAVSAAPHDPLPAGRFVASAQSAVPDTSKSVSSFRGSVVASTSKSTLRPSDAKVAQTRCDLSLLAKTAQEMFGWDAENTVKRFKSLIWDGHVLRRALSITLHLDRERAGGQVIRDPVVASRPAPKSPTKKISVSRKASSQSLGDLTITPEARRFANFFEKSVNVKTPQREGSDDQAIAEGSSRANTKSGTNQLPSFHQKGEIEIIEVSQKRWHAKYGGLGSELRISYATDGLRKATKDGLASGWARGADGMFAPHAERAEDWPAGNNSDDVDSVSGKSSAKPSGSDQEDEEDELVTLSQVKRKQDAQTKVNAVRMWIPKVLIAELPYFHDPLDVEDAKAATSKQSPQQLVVYFEQVRQEKADKERFKAQNKEAKKRGGKLSKPEAGQRSIVDFFPTSGKGKGKARDTGGVKRPGPTRKEQPRDEFDSSMSDDDRPPVAQRASSPIRPSTSKIQLPRRFNLPPSSESGSDGSIVMMSSPPPKTRLSAPQQALAPSPLKVSTSGQNTAASGQGLSQGSSTISSSEFDELIDEVPSQATMVATESVLPQWTGLRPTANIPASEDDDDEDDNSLPNILSQRYKQSQSSTVGNAKHRKASRSPLVSAEEEAGSDRGTGPSKASLQRSPKKSPRKAKGQQHAWSSQSATTDSQKAAQPRPRPLDLSARKKKALSAVLLSDSEDDEEDSQPGASDRPASPSPLPRRLSRPGAIESNGTQDISASFEIVAEIRGSGRKSAPFVLDSD